jgi:SAM-dependent methyltransferase
MEESNVKHCCAAFYGSDLARVLLGDSFHPGGIQLTHRLGELLGLHEQSRLLDVAAGRGTSAFHLAETFHCRVTGVDLSETNVHAASAEAASRGLNKAVRFELGDAERLPFPDESFDAIVCECAFCTFPGKATAAQEFFRVLKHGGQVGISDLTRTEEQIPDLDGLLAWIACIGDALPLEQYASILQAAGMRVQCTEQCNDALEEMVRGVQSRLLGMELMTGLGKLQLPGIDLSSAKQFATAAGEAIQKGSLGYAVIIARRPY